MTEKTLNIVLMVYWFIGGICIGGYFGHSIQTPTYYKDVITENIYLDTDLRVIGRNEAIITYKNGVIIMKQ